MSDHSAKPAPVVAPATTVPGAGIAALNDALRQSFLGGRVMVSAGVSALPADTRASLLAAVQAFAAFTPDNDPYGEHNCGAVTAAGLRALWKIDAYDRSLTQHSSDPTDPAVTVRVLTVMLAEEW